MCDHSAALEMLDDLTGESEEGRLTVTGTVGDRYVDMHPRCDRETFVARFVNAYCTGRDEES